MLQVKQYYQREDSVCRPQEDALAKQVSLAIVCCHMELRNTLSPYDSESRRRLLLKSSLSPPGREMAFLADMLSFLNAHGRNIVEVGLQLEAG